MDGCDITVVDYGTFQRRTRKWETKICLWILENFFKGCIDHFSPIRIGENKKYDMDKIKRTPD